MSAPRHLFPRRPEPYYAPDDEVEPGDREYAEARIQVWEEGYALLDWLERAYVSWGLDVWVPFEVRLTGPIDGIGVYGARRRAPWLTWRQPGGLPECPYYHRWILDLGFVSVRLHRWERSDDDRAYHDHPYWFVTLVLSGGYTDVSPGPEGTHVHDHLGPGSVRFRRAEYRHTVQITRSPTWTVLLTGPPRRRWAFFVGARRVMRDKYFVTYGHHPCDSATEPVRMRPDGSRLAPRSEPQEAPR